jgi:hypothetical protein
VLAPVVLAADAVVVEVVVDAAGFGAVVVVDDEDDEQPARASATIPRPKRPQRRDNIQSTPCSLRQAVGRLPESGKLRDDVWSFNTIMQQVWTRRSDEHSHCSCRVALFRSLGSSRQKRRRFSNVPLRRRCRLLAETFQQSGSGLLFLILIAVLVGVGALFGSMWSRRRKKTK